MRKNTFMEIKLYFLLIFAPFNISNSFLFHFAITDEKNGSVFIEVMLWRFFVLF